MGKYLKINKNCQAIQSHLTILQTIISRMATNSASSKTWCITLISAILIIVAEKGKPEFLLLALFPIILFYILDSYYLCLERKFRNEYDFFIKKLHNKQLKTTDLFVIKPKDKTFFIFIRSLYSVSVLPFYLILSIMIYILKVLVF